MKALTLAEFGRMEVVDLPDPTPQAGEVRIDLVATGICGSDLHGYTGENGRRIPGQVMGHESVGRVSALGDGVTAFEVGQPVTFNPVLVPADEVDAYAGREQMSPGKKVIGVATDLIASFAQRICLPERNVVAVPYSMPIELGALIEPLAVAVHAVRRAGVQPGDALLVLGGGPIGQSVVLAAQMAGVSRIVVTETLGARRDLIESLGAQSVDARAGYAGEQITRILGGAADVAIDAVGIEPTVRLALRTTRIGATICLVGMGAPQFTLDAFRISTEERALIGSFTYSAQDFTDAADWMGTAPEQASSLISRQVPLREGPNAFATLAEGADVPGKVLVRLDQVDQESRGGTIS